MLNQKIVDRAKFNASKCWEFYYKFGMRIKFDNSAILLLLLLVIR